MSSTVVKGRVSHEALAITLCNLDVVGTVDSQNIVLIKFSNLQKIEFCVFELCEFAATWSVSYTLKVAALIIANFASEAKR